MVVKALQRYSEVYIRAGLKKRTPAEYPQKKDTIELQHELQDVVHEEGEYDRKNSHARISMHRERRDP